VSKNGVPPPFNLNKQDGIMLAIFGYQDTTSSFAVIQQRETE
jgi:hypothetical protein